MADAGNLIDAEFTQEQLDAFLRHIDEAEAQLAFLVTLTPDQRQVLPKLGQSMVGFVNQGLSLVRRRSEFMPRSFDIERMQRDVDMLNRISAALNRVASLVVKLRDTRMAAGSESLKGGLDIYRNAKDNGAADIQPEVEAMGENFHRGKQEEEEAAEAPAS